MPWFRCCPPPPLLSLPVHLSDGCVRCGCATQVLPLLMVRSTSIGSDRIAVLQAALAAIVQHLRVMYDHAPITDAVVARKSECVSTMYTCLLAAWGDAEAVHGSGSGSGAGVGVGVNQSGGGGSGSGSGNGERHHDI